MITTTWDLMKKYNLPCPGSRIVVVDYLDSYITPERVYLAEWYQERGCPSGVYMRSSFGATNVAPWQFRTCTWRYATDDSPLAWPRAEYQPKDVL